MDTMAYRGSGLQGRPAADTDDRSLIRRVAEGRDVGAFERLYHSYRRRLGPFLYRFTQDRTVNEEVFNDVMMAVWRKADSYNGASQVSTWIFSIAYRQCLKRLNARVEEVELTETIVADGLDSPSLEQSDLVARALQYLSPEHRLVIELWYFQGAKYQEIGAIAGCPENTVKTRMFHARRHLRKILVDLGESGEGRNDHEQ